MSAVDVGLGFRFGTCLGPLPEPQESERRTVLTGKRPDPYWADDVVAGIIASVRALVGIDELHVRTEARYSGSAKRVAPED